MKVCLEREGMMRPQEPGQSVASIAEIYEQYMVPAAFALWATDLLALLALPPGSRVLDVACGTGIVARTAVHHTGATGVVVGLDLHAGMLAVARAQDPTGAWVHGSVSALPFTTSAFDVVVCQQGLQFFPDRLTALREMYRVLRPGGRVALAVWGALDHNPGHAALAQGLAHHMGTAVAAVLHTSFSLGDAEVFQRLLEQAGFRDVVLSRSVRTLRFASPAAFVRVWVQGSVLGRAGVQVHDDVLTALVREVTAALHPYSNAEGLGVPIVAHLAVGRTAGECSAQRASA
jgi:ubiquinone/menaquinone biosynthesis C-methylase UbiE